MELGTVGVIVAVFSFLGGVVGAALSNWVSTQLARDERLESRRRERFEYLSSTFDKFLKAYSEVTADRDRRSSVAFEHLLAKCRSILYSVGDEELSRCADELKVIVINQKMGMGDNFFDRLEEQLDVCVNRFADVLKFASQLDRKV